MRYFILSSWIGCYLLVGWVIPINAADLSPPGIKDGVLDLSSWDFDQRSLINLDGEWQFFWNQLLSPQAFEDLTREMPPDLLPIPGKWSRHTFHGSPMHHHGGMTLRVKIKLPATPGRLGLRIPVIHSAYGLWIDGVFRKAGGIPGMSADTTRPRWNPGIVLFQPKQQEVELILQVANFTTRSCGLLFRLQLGHEEAILNKRTGNLVKALFIMGALMIMGCYHVVLYIFRRQKRSPLYFGLCCLLVSMFAGMTGEAIMATFLFPTIPWEIYMKLFYLSYMTATPQFAMFVHDLYPKEVHHLVIRLLQGLWSVAAIIILLTPNRINTYTAPIFQSIVILACLYLAICLTVALVKQRGGGPPGLWAASRCCY